MPSSVDNLEVPVSSTIPSTSGSTYSTGAPLYKVAPVAKILVEPCKALQSPFLVKRQSLRRPDAKILEDLYHDITTSNDMPEVKDIRKLVKVGEMMNNIWLNYAVDNLGREDARDFSNTKCLGWRHYVDSDWAIQSLKGPLNPEDPKDLKHLFYRGSVLYNASQSHMVFIPVFHDAHWTLYAFNMYDQKLSILDSRPDTTEGGHDPAERHQKTRCDLCDALTVTMNSAIDFRSWEYEFPKLPREQNSNDCGFFVFNFMRLWDGHRLVRWFPIESRELRKDFLAYVLSCKDNNIHMPERIYSKINYLPGKMMDCTMHKVAREGRRLRTDQGENGSVRNGPDVEAPDPESASSDFLRRCQQVTSDGDGVLHIATRFGNVELVRDILENNAALAEVLLLAVNNIGDTTLHCAAARGSDKIVTRFLGHMFETDTGEVIAKLLRAQNLKGETCLHEAVRHGHVDIVRKLIDKDNEGEFGRRALVQIVGNEGTSPLFLATTLRKIEIVKALVVHPASAAGPAGKTALHAAVVLLDKELVKILLDWKAGLTSQADESGSTPLHFLASLPLERREPNAIVFPLYKLQKYLNIVIKFLCCKPSQDPGIIDLVMGKDPLSALYADCTGSMPIHIAAAHGRLDIVKELLKCCYCESSRNASGQTFLHVAVEKEKLDIVDYVCIEKKFNRILNTVDQDGNTALHLAVNNASEKIVCTLMQNREVCLNLANKEGRTPLDLAFLSLHPKLICMKGSREWIFFDLLHGGGDFGVGSWDHLARDIVEPDWEKESERVGKSASMLAVCAVLILNVALLAPFNVIREMDKDVPFNVVAFQIFVVSDSMAFVCSATATFTCARAGFTMSDGWTCLKNLITGTFALGIAALALIITVALALFLVLPERTGFLPIITAGFGIFFHLVSFVKSKIISTVDHLRAIQARVGFPRLAYILLFQRSAIKPLWVVPSASTSLFLVGGVCRRHFCHDKLDYTQSYWMNVI